MNELSEYYYHLPQELISAYPAPSRDKSRLLAFDAKHPMKLYEGYFHEIIDFLRPDDLLIMNHSRVSFRKLYLRRKSGALLEALFLEKRKDQKWQCLLRRKRKLQDRERLFLCSSHKEDIPVEFLFFSERSQHSKRQNASDAYLLPVIAKTENAAWPTCQAAEEFFLRYGHPPIPPYLGRKAEAIDRERYQTVYAKESGSVAAPTAGLHFSIELLRQIEKQSIPWISIQLHLGYGTFAPLIKKNFEENKLHKESYSISSETARILNKHKKGRKIAVGTSSLRALESNFRQHNRKFIAGKFHTELFLKPPDCPRSIQGLITNFHLPGSSLLLLVASYVGKENVLRIYKHAVQRQYRFFSYGDAMAIFKD